jgi:hypothetical protein
VCVALSLNISHDCTCTYCCYRQLRHLPNEHSWYFHGEDRNRWMSRYHSNVHHPTKYVLYLDHNAPEGRHERQSLNRMCNISCVYVINIKLFFSDVMKDVVCYVLASLHFACTSCTNAHFDISTVYICIDVHKP